MGVLKFRIHPPDLANRLPDLRCAYVTGLDRTPGHASVEVRPGLVIVHRENTESGRVHVSWPVPGFGAPVLSTATLVERNEPYDLAVELARGRLNDVRNQTAGWSQMGLQVPPELRRSIDESQRHFARAVTSQGNPAAAAETSGRCLAAALRADELLIRAYTEQVLRRRRDHAARLSTLLSCTLEGDPRESPLAPVLTSAFNAARIGCSWGKLAPHEGQIQWEEPDAQLAWCRAAKLTPTAGPLLDLRPGALPDWLWLWGGDYEGIVAMAADLIRQVLGRYRGKVALWHLVHRAGVGEILGLNEEEQVRLTARALQVARQVDPHTQLVIDFERPWAGWLGTSPFQLGPIHLADSLARADLGLAGIGLEIAPGFGVPGSHLRDVLDFSRLLDHYALINLPVHVSFALPSSVEPDPKADAAVAIRAAQWPSPPTEQLQRDWAAPWVALAVAKPFVRSVNWEQVSDATPHLFPNAGLFRPDQTPKPVVEWLKGFRVEYLEPARP